MFSQNAGDCTPETGCCDSEDGSVSYGYSLLRGKRASMEDFHEAQFKECAGGEKVAFFGVFDGHGGPRAAEYIKSHLFQNLLRHPAFPSDLQKAITEVYVQTDKNYMCSDSGMNRDDGSTAATALLVGKRLLVANVGDSRAVMSRAGKAVAMSVDHKPNRLDERQRIEKAGGAVLWAGTWRVGGVLAVSRAFGDRLLKRFVVAEPEIQEHCIRQDDEFLVLATDGLWDVLSNQEAVDLARDIPDAEEAARELTREAYRRGSADNITCVVVRFHDEKTASARQKAGKQTPTSNSELSKAKEKT